ncbi:nitroreductase [Sphaerochaeta pleomorpha str. Grapes]|uniref:Nitroreductase n=1 Tax=Sphaerochaeta pleomorpha (strain ATCC BAA-1885 / DSM 22778 / Grapes) TaxID=158190 RepID=G8QUD4_SPHPG|nr:nitroreductase family protein [Sphaerochaeta pleomorpha]AEV28104.1 nitroreductase [Sphaerochaeta pleomorpha str. Grapes]
MKVIQDRRSIRKYTGQEIDEKTLAHLLESAQLAPSGSNSQPWHFLVITNKEMREKVAKVSHDQKWMLNAPLFIVCIAEIDADQECYLDEDSPDIDLKRGIRDTSIAAEHIVLEATARGLGTCWVAWFTQKEIRSVLDLPSYTYVVGILTVGYPDENPMPRNRKTLQEIVHYETW